MATLHPGLVAPAAVNASIDSVSIAVDDGAQTAKLTVNFTVQDANGAPIPHLGDASATNATRFAYLRFAMSKLQPAVAGSHDADMWVNYTTGDRTPANLTDHGDGTYTYLFSTNLYSIYDPALTHRLLLTVSGSAVPQAKNVTYDFVPAQLPGPFTFTTTRNIVTTEACNGCHGRLGSPLGSASFHGGSRYTIEACTVCHTTTLGAPDLVPPGSGEFAPMIHRIHAAKNLGDLGDYTGVTYPGQKGTDTTSTGYNAPIDCAKCHAGTAGDNWNTRPTMTACGSCHDDNFAAGTSHGGGVQTNNQTCTVCHPVTGGLAGVKESHTPTDKTLQNPDIPPGLAQIDYVIENVAVNASNQAVVTFHINKDGLPLDLSTYPPTGFSGGPSFLVAYTLAQDGVTAPIDYNNRGRSAAQPASVTLASLAASLTGTPASYTATLTSAAFPAGAGMRAVALQGYFTQLKGGSVTADTPRHTRSVVKAAGVGKCALDPFPSCLSDADCSGTGNSCKFTSDTVRREIVDEAKCLACHEILSLHGGNRVNNPQVCVICHNPNLSSSGRGTDKRCSVTTSKVCASSSDCPATEECKYLLSSTDSARLTSDGYDATNPLTWPEATLNLKELVHGIHAAAVRTFPYEFVRDRLNSGAFYYNWSEVTFPGVPSNCLTCHKPGTFDADLPSGVLITTDVTTDGTNATPAAVRAARATVPNDTDLVNSPTASACYFCHDNNAAANHFGQNGGVIDAERAGALGK